MSTMAQAWSQPEPPKTFSLRDFGGDVALYVHGGLHAEVPTEHGVKPACRGTFILLTGRAAGSVNEDVMVWGKMGTQFAAEPPGSIKLGRIRVDRATTFEPFTTYDEQLASQWMAANPGLLAHLRDAAVATFHTRAAEMQQMGGQTHAGRTSPQFQPPPPPQGYGAPPMPAVAQAPPAYAPVGTPAPAPMPPLPNTPAAYQQGLSGPYNGAQPAPQGQPPPPPAPPVNATMASLEAYQPAPATYPPQPPQAQPEAPPF